MYSMEMLLVRPSAARALGGGAAAKLPDRAAMEMAVLHCARVISLSGSSGDKKEVGALKQNRLRVWGQPSSVTRIPSSAGTERIRGRKSRQPERADRRRNSDAWSRCSRRCRHLPHPHYLGPGREGTAERFRWSPG